MNEKPVGVDSGAYSIPPIGIMPRYIWEEKRFHELKEAFYRYHDTDLPIPLEWIEEYNELIIRKKGYNFYRKLNRQ